MNSQDLMNKGFKIWNLFSKLSGEKYATGYGYLCSKI